MKSMNIPEAKGLTNQPIDEVKKRRLAIDGVHIEFAIVVPGFGNGHIIRFIDRNAKGLEPKNETADENNQNAVSPVFKTHLR